MTAVSNLACDFAKGERFEVFDPPGVRSGRYYEVVAERWPEPDGTQDSTSIQARAAAGGPLIRIHMSVEVRKAEIREWDEACGLAPKGVGEKAAVADVVKAVKTKRKSRPNLHVSPVLPATFAIGTRPVPLRETVLVCDVVRADDDELVTPQWVRAVIPPRGGPTSKSSTGFAQAKHGPSAVAVVWRDPPAGPWQVTLNGGPWVLTFTRRRHFRAVCWGLGIPLVDTTPEIREHGQRSTAPLPVSR